MVVEIFKSACLNRAMTTSSLVGDFKSHEDQRMIADTETTSAFDIRCGYTGHFFNVGNCPFTT